MTGCRQPQQNSCHVSMQDPLTSNWVISPWKITHGLQWLDSRNNLLIPNHSWIPGEFLSSLPLQFPLFHWYTLRSTDLIIKHPAVANSLVILFKGIPQTMAAFVSKHSLSDIECKLIFYVHSVGREGCVYGQHLSLECLPGHHHQPQRLHVGRAETTSSQIHWQFQHLMLDPEHVGQYPCSSVHEWQVQLQKQH